MVPCHPEELATQDQHPSDSQHLKHRDLTPTLRLSCASSARPSSKGHFLLDFTQVGASLPWAPPCPCGSLALSPG